MKSVACRTCARHPYAPVRLLKKFVGRASAEIPAAAAAPATVIAAKKRMLICWPEIAGENWHTLAAAEDARC